MYLKSLTLKGFKSFASSTTLQLEPGITCIVGPNGSGKSNVVDALAWVMGEQGAKSLRGGKMEDVIFAGTAGRPPLGRAEVALTIDNTDGALPIEYTEVTISRTMFRNGGSEYAINGSACRLLDVQELLSDSGIGREMHVIVGQGQLDAVLHATPGGPPRLHRGGRRRPQAPQAQGEGAAQARGDGGQPDPAGRPRHRDPPPAQAARAPGRGGPAGRGRAGRRARRPRPAAGRRPGHRPQPPSSRSSPTRPPWSSVAREVERALAATRETEAALEEALREDLPALARGAGDLVRPLRAARAPARHREPGRRARAQRRLPAGGARGPRPRRARGRGGARPGPARRRSSPRSPPTGRRSTPPSRPGRPPSRPSPLEERRVAELQRAAADRREGVARLHGQVNGLRSRAAAAEEEVEPAHRGPRRGRRPGRARPARLHGPGVPHRRPRRRRGGARRRARRAPAPSSPTSRIDWPRCARSSPAPSASARR